jgi:beta-glucoside operon transcriptional antiterminator
MPGAGDAPIPPGGVQRLLNNNVVVAIDADGRERVLMGRGIGFQLKHEGRVDPAKVEKTFVLDQATDTAHARKLLTDAPYALVQAVLHAVDEAERELGRDLGRRLPLAVIDHVNYVIERLDQGIRIPGTSMPELRIQRAEGRATSWAASPTPRSKGASGAGRSTRWGCASC